MTTVLITGGAGFIGSHLVDFLLDEDFTVVVLDNLSTGKMDNINSVRGRSAKQFVGDVTNPNDVSKALTDVEIVLHLSAQSSVNVSMKRELFDAQNNVLGTLELLKQAHAKEIDHFLFTSTGGAIYGIPNNLPVSESHPEQPISIYGTSKLAAEKYIEFYQRMGLETSILRLANVYGPRQDPSGEAGVISIFLGNILNNLPLHVYGDGSSSRDYIYVKDVADIILRLIDNPIQKPINVATGKEVFLKELLETIQNVTNTQPKIIYEDERHGDVKNIYLDPSRIKQLVGWTPSTNLAEGIKQVWAWINSTR